MCMCSLRNAREVNGHFPATYYACFISETIERFSLELGFLGVCPGKLILVRNCPLYTLFYSKFKLKCITFLKKGSQYKMIGT
jgi:hypothetical protein